MSCQLSETEPRNGGKPDSGPNRDWSVTCVISMIADVERHARCERMKRARKPGRDWFRSHGIPLGSCHHAVDDARRPGSGPDAAPVARRPKPAAVASRPLQPRPCARRCDPDRRRRPSVQRANQCDGREEPQHQRQHRHRSAREVERQSLPLLEVAEQPLHAARHARRVAEH